MEVSVNTVSKSNVKAEMPNEVAQGKATLQPLLGGNNVNVVTASDFQKLLAELQATAEEKNKAAALTVLSNELNHLLGIAKGLEEGQKKSLIELQVETAKLEALIKANTKTAADRKAEMETKNRLEKQRKELESKVKDLDTQIKKEQSAEVVDTKKLTELQAAKQKAETELSDVNRQTGESEKKLAEFDAKITKNEAEQRTVTAAINSIVAKLNGSGLAILLQATRSTADHVISQMNGLLKDKLEDEINEFGMKDIVGIFSKILDKKTEDMQDEIVSKKNEIV